MPTYEYKHCGRTFERNVPIAERDEVRCPRCNRKAKRLMPRSVQFNSSMVTVSYTGRDGAIYESENAKIRDFNERQLAADNVAELTEGKDHRFRVRPERVRELKQEINKQKCQKPQQSA